MSGEPQARPVDRRVEPVLACGSEPVGWLQRLALPTSRRLGIADTPAVTTELTDELAVRARPWSPAIYPSMLEMVLRSAGRSARWNRDLQWSNAIGRISTRALVFLVLSVPVVWFVRETWMVVSMLVIQLLLCWSLALLMAMQLADRERCRGEDHLPLVGLRASGGIGAMPSVWAQELARGPSLSGSSAALGYLREVGFEDWFESTALQPGEREVFDALLGEHQGNLDELVRIARELGNDESSDLLPGQ